MTEAFSGDLSSLLTRLASIGHADFPSQSHYLGYMALGSEALWGKTSATFHVPLLSIDIKTATAGNA